MHKDAVGTAVATLQRLLQSAGFNLTADGWFGDSTEKALIAFQHRAGLVADGIAGPKTITALRTRERNRRLLSEADLEKAADRLGVQLAAIKAVNTVEANGRGFLDDGRPVILYERHVAYRLLGVAGLVQAVFAAKYPALVAEKRGGYAGDTAEWSRLTSAKQIMPSDIAQSSCSWGQFQIMGYHWQRLGYASIDAFVAAMHESEAAQLDAFCRFIEAEPALHKALKARKWADFARIYNGPAYRENACYLKLACAFKRYSPKQDIAQA